jgi:hypothetical protein
VLLHWQNVTPFGVRSSRQFRAPRPPPLVSSRYTQDFEEVMTVGAINSTGRPQDRADVAILYAVHLAGPVWNQVVRQVSAAQGTGLSANARAFALLNMAIADGLITVMETKYHYNFWRPETAIREAASDGNRATSPDPTFAPFVITPCHPSYPSAHATASYAARTIIEPIWGSDNHSIVMETPALPQIVLSYSRLDQITTVSMMRGCTAGSTSGSIRWPALARASGSASTSSGIIYGPEEAREPGGICSRQDWLRNRCREPHLRIRRRAGALGAFRRGEPPQHLLTRTPSTRSASSLLHHTNQIP